MKERCVLATMKPLACETGSRNCNNNCFLGNQMKSNLKLVGILNPCENNRGFLVVAATPTDLSTEHQRLQVFSSFCPKKLTMDYYLHCDYSSKGNQVMKFNNTTNYFDQQDKLLILSEKWKCFDENLAIYLVPVDPNTGDVMINDCVRLEQEIFTVGFSSEKLVKEKPLEADFFISREQWKTLAHCVITFREHFFEEAESEKGNGKTAGFSVKSRKQDASASTSSSRKSGSFLKWITTKNNGKGQRAEKAKASRQRADFTGDDLGKENRGVDEVCDGVKKKFVAGQGKESFAMKKQKIKKSGQINYKYMGKFKRMINFSSTEVKKSELCEETGGKGSKIEKDKQQLIRIELRPNPIMQDTSFKFCSGDLLRLKMTMYQKEWDVGNERNYHQVEIDFVQNLMCETNTFNACRCRRITKLLKRTVITELKWEKGIHISGQQFALCWIPYKIPVLVDEKAENKGKNEEADGLFSVGKLDDKFNVTRFQYELQIRFYEKVTSCEQNHHVLAACSCFPLNIMTIMTDFIENNQSLSLFASEDSLQVVPEEEDVERLEVEKVTGKCEQSLMMMIKSLSATEFDV